MHALPSAVDESCRLVCVVVRGWWWIGFLRIRRRLCRIQRPGEQSRAQPLSTMKRSESNGTTSVGSLGRSYFFPILDTQVPTAFHTSEVTPRSARWVAEGPRRRRGVHHDGLEEAHHPSTDGITFFVRVRPESRSEQLRASVIRSRRRNYHASSVCATANRLPYPPT